MEKYITPASIASQIQMEMLAHSGTFLLVEGNGDARLFGRFLDRECCRLIDTRGKYNAMGATELLSQRGVARVVAVVDADWDRLLGTEVEHPNLFYTDQNDLEMMMICSEAGRALVEEKSDPQHLRAAGIEEAGQALLLLFRKAAPLGGLRYLSAKNGWNLSFRAISESHLNQCTLEIDRHRLCANVIRANRSRCEEIGLTVDELHKALQRELEALDDVRCFCRGHDVTMLVGYALRELFARRGTERASSEEVESDLRMAYRWEDFCQTDLCAGLDEWQQENGRIFRLS